MKRPGFTLVEIFAAIAVLAVCAILFAQLVSLTTSARLAERTHQTAVDQMQNILERLAIGDFDSDGFDKRQAEALIERSLPEGKIAFDTTEIDSGNVVFTVTVSWSNGEGKPRREIAMFRLLTLDYSAEHPLEIESNFD
jgi:prepilin-type N-terminal cleavage/methylation domain-containing protein